MTYLNFRDMIDGGGAGQSGDTFQGGPLSGLLNMLGIKPAGFRDRMGLLSPSMPSSSGSMAPHSPPPPRPSVGGPPLGSMPGAPDAALSRVRMMPPSDPMTSAPAMPGMGAAPTLPGGQTPVSQGIGYEMADMANETVMERNLQLAQRMVPGLSAQPFEVQIEIARAIAGGVPVDYFASAFTPRFVGPQ